MELKRKNKYDRTYLLFSENISYLHGEVPYIHNSAQVLENLMRNSNTKEMVFWKRIIWIIVLLTSSVLCLWFSFIPVRFAPFHWGEAVFVVLAGIVTLFLSRSVFGLAMNRPEIVHNRLQLLQQKGTVVIGEIVNQDVRSFNQLELVYKFKTSTNQNVYGRYRIPLPYNHELNQVYVLYLDKRTHTLI